MKIVTKEEVEDTFAKNVTKRRLSILLTILLWKRTLFCLTVEKSRSENLFKISATTFFYEAYENHKGYNQKRILSAKTRSEKSLREIKEEKKTNLKVPKKGTLISVVLLCLLVGTVAYALLSNYKDIAHQLSIKGVNVKLWIWIDDVTPPTVEKNTHDWNKMGANEVSNTEFLLIESISTENGTLSFSNNLNPSFGVVDFYIEYWDNSLTQWVALNWQDQIDAGTSYKDSSYVPGTPQNPLKPNDMIGFRPGSPADKDLGHVWIRITISASPPFESTSFTTTATITEYI